MVRLSFYARLRPRPGKGANALQSRLFDAGLERDAMPRARRMNALVALLVWIVAAIAVAEPAFSRPTAVVTDLAGSVTLVRGAGRQGVTLLTEVGDGEHVELAPGARVQFILYWTSQAFVAQGPARLRFGYGGPVAVEGAAPRRLENVALPPLNASGYARPLTAAPGAPGGGVVLMSPVGIRVIGASPEFVWQGAPGDGEYRFALSSDKGVTIFETRTRAARVRLPAGIRLEPGRPHSWQVGVAAPDGERVASAGFSTVLDELAAETRQFRPRDDAPTAELIAYALWLRQLRFGEEEKRYWRLLLARHPGEPLVRAMADE